MLLWPFVNVIKRKNNNCALVSVVRSTNEWKGVFVFKSKIKTG